MWLVFQLLERYKTDPGNLGFDEMVDNAVAQMDWGSQSYLADHVRNIAVRVYDELKQLRSRSEHEAG